MPRWLVYKWLPNGEQYFVAELEAGDVDEVLEALGARGLRGCRVAAELSPNRVYELLCGYDYLYAERIS